MSVDLTQPEDTLKYIMSLDLSQCDIAVCLASGESSATYQFRTIPQTLKLGQKFVEAINEALKKYRQGLEEHDIELHEFAAETTKPDQEIEYLNIMPYDSIKRQIEPVSHHRDLPYFEHGDKEFIKNMRFYVIRIQENGAGGPPIYFYRNYSETLMLSKSPWFAMLQLQKGMYDNLEEPTFLFDRHIDCISCEDHMFILQKTNFFKIFEIGELEKVAKEMLNWLAQKDFIHNFDRFKRDCLNDKTKILKLKNISTKTYLTQLTVDDLSKIIDRYKLPIQINIVGGKKKLLYNPKERWAILHLLDDTYADSPMTKSSYHIKGKREIRRK